MFVGFHRYILGPIPAIVEWQSARIAPNLHLIRCRPVPVEILKHSSLGQDSKREDAPRPLTLTAAVIECRAANTIGHSASKICSGNSAHPDYTAVRVSSIPAWKSCKCSGFVTGGRWTRASSTTIQRSMCCGSIIGKMLLTERRQQGVGIRQAERAQSRENVGPLHFADGNCRSRDKPIGSSQNMQQRPGRIITSSNSSR